MGKHWDRDTALAQIEYCNFECEGGPLSKNVAYEWLKKALNIGPKFLPGQGVFYQVEAIVSNVKVSQWAHFYVVGVRMDSGTDDRFWTYTISNDPPAPYHYGTAQFSGIKEDQLLLEAPAEART